MVTDAAQDLARTELGELLDEVLVSCGIKTVSVITRDGSLVATRGDTSYLDTTALAALVGGMFTATREVARMIGEEHFSILLQQGEKRHIHISLLSSDFMLTCIFEDESLIGKLRIRSRRHAGRIAELAAAGWEPRGLVGVASPQEQPQPLSPAGAEFREYALDLIDRIFSE